MTFATFTASLCVLASIFMSDKPHYRYIPQSCHPDFFPARVLEQVRGGFVAATIAYHLTMPRASGWLALRRSVSFGVRWPALGLSLSEALGRTRRVWLAQETSLPLTLVLPRP
jgi:hypothetical protein